MCAGYEEQDKTHRQHIGKTNKRGKRDKTRQEMETTDKNKDKDTTKRKAGQDTTDTVDKNKDKDMTKKKGRTRQDKTDTVPGAILKLPPKL